MRKVQSKEFSRDFEYTTAKRAERKASRELRQIRLGKRSRWEAVE